MATLLLLIALGAPTAGSLAIVVLRPTGLRAGRVLTVACGLATISSLVLLGWSATTDDGLVSSASWAGLDLDRAAAVLLTVVSATGLVVTSFARRSLDLDPRSRWFAIRLGILLSGSSLVVVPGGPLPLVIGWLASSWALVELVGFTGDARSAPARRRTRLALTVGDVALVAAVVLASTAGWSGLTGAEARADDGWGELAGIDITHVVAVLFVAAGVARSSLVPLHRWLVSTVVAPTPVSAIVHAGFVSGAGLLLIRFADLFTSSTIALHLAFAIGVVTVVVALGSQGTRADVKGKLAWSTVAQMGFMVLQCAAGAFSSAVVHIAGHGMYKASLFLGAGDAVSAHLRSTRRPPAAPSLSPTAGLVASGAIATAATIVGLLLITPDMTDSAVVLIAVFSWVTVASGVRGWFDRTPLRPTPAIGVAAGGALSATLIYLAGLRAFKAFLDPSFERLPGDAGVEPLVLVAVLAAVAGVALAAVAGRLPFGDRLPALVERTAHPGLAPTRSGPARPGAAPVDRPSTVGTSDSVQRALLQADVATAARVVAPLWPLTSFVAVNPLGGFERRSFDEASAIARHHLRARSHLTLDGYRQDHRRGLTTTEDLQWAIAGHLYDSGLDQPIELDGRTVDAATVVECDLLHGPDVTDDPVPVTALERREGVDGPVGALIDVTLAHSAAQHVSRSTTGAGSAAFVTRWKRDAVSVGAIGAHLDAGIVGWLDDLGDDPLGILDAAIEAVGVSNDDRTETLERHLARLPGWSGYARWRTDWAHSTETAALLSPLDLLAARTALEAAWLLSNPGEAAGGPERPASDDQPQRVAAVLAALGAADQDPAAHPELGEIIAGLPPGQRPALWLAAQERNFDRRLLSTLDRLDPGRRLETPPAQLVFCIDVRSEGLRYQLEEIGPYETLGFAGFFGIPMSVRRVDWSDAEARCPVLVAPSVSSIERPHDRPSSASTGPDRLIGDARRADSLEQVAARAKHRPGAGFVTAEAAGWLTGPLAAARTLLPRRTAATPQRPTAMVVDTQDLDRRVDLAEAVLTTMGLRERFAPLVVLCGHASANVNNPHATALDCGACAGASGEDNARAVAALLNEVEVRRGLAGRGIEIPDGTHFMPALHETVSDRVDLLDRAAAPATHRTAIDRLVDDLDRAGSRQSGRRAIHLPGRAAAVRDRGADWAQVRPEWGLARNAAFVIGPRSMTAGLDLDGRAFLHSYDAELDPEGRVLETIMTAPLIVAHWISSQYYFSTVDTEAFGAGDKLIHNVVGNVGVISGEHGDLRVGLPLQSTHCGPDRHHQPIRLVAVIQAPLDRIEGIIQRNSILGTLTVGKWLRIVGRSHPHERWSTRSPRGTWSAEPRPLDAIYAQEHP